MLQTACPVVLGSKLNLVLIFTKGDNSSGKSAECGQSRPTEFTLFL